VNQHENQPEVLANFPVEQLQAPWFGTRPPGVAAEDAGEVPLRPCRRSEPQRQKIHSRPLKSTANALKSDESKIMADNAKNNARHPCSRAS
jgi:hypothetical protein